MDVALYNPDGKLRAEYRNSRIKLVALVYKEKVMHLVQDSSIEQQCRDIYSSALGSFDAIIDSSANFGESSIASMLSAANSLREYNQKTEIYSCPLIY